MAYENLRNYLISSLVDAKMAMFPVVKAEDEELVDPQTVLKEKCHKEGKAQSLWGKYEECNARVNSRKKTAETCSEELVDYLHVVDHCVAHTLWSKLK